MYMTLLTDIHCLLFDFRQTNSLHPLSACFARNKFHGIYRNKGPTTMTE